MRTLVWFRGKDLRLSDHEPLCDAVAAGTAIPVFVLDPHFFAPERAAALPHRMQFLLDSLHELAARIEEKGSRLLVVRGRSVDVIPDLANRWGIDRVCAHRWVEPFARERDRRIAAALDVPFVLYEGETLIPPGTLRTSGGTPYAVFTPFSRAWRSHAAIGRPRNAPAHIAAVPAGLESEGEAVPTLESLGLSRNPNLITGGEKAARRRLRTFRRVAARYHTDRDRMDLPGTSRLSADLKFGTLSPRTLWTQLESAIPDLQARNTFSNELVWREFTHSTLWDRPELSTEPFRAKWKGLPWSTDEHAWHAWVEGRTGYPIVDAASRQLLAEGFVHNRARMITASFLTKHLLIDYRRGEAHFMKYLVDGDWAQNNAGWQWSAGCGCDAQPYFRIFNPITQGKRFDPTAEYVRRWVPELARLPNRFIHEPWAAAASVLDAAEVRVGETYPAPIVEHAIARQRYLEVARRHLNAGTAKSDHRTNGKKGSSGARPRKNR